MLSRFSTCEFLRAKRICYCLNKKELNKNLISSSRELVRQKIRANNSLVENRQSSEGRVVTEIVDFTSETVVHATRRRLGDDIKCHRQGILTTLIQADASLSKIIVGNAGRSTRRNFSQQTVS